MRRVTCTVVTTIFLTCLPFAAEAQQALTAQLVSDIKAATVFVKIKAGEMAGSGSGFVIHVEGDTAFIVTNRHVVEPKVPEIVVVRDPRAGGRGGGMRRGRGMPGFAQPFVPPMMPGMPGFAQQQQEEESPHFLARVVVHEYKNTEVTAVFRSGMKDEESAAGSLVAVDPDEDLAVVKVKGVKQRLKPIEYANSPQPTETMPIYVFGFPLGEDLATGKHNPAITVGKGSVSSLRNDDDGNLSKVQLDAALNHGNSGGPVVDAQGLLVGVASFRIEGDDSQNISFAVPARAVSRLLQGRLAKTELRAAKNGDDGMTIHVAVGLVDPLKKIKSAEFRYVSASAVSSTPKPSDSLVDLPGCHTLHLKIENGVASGEINVKKKVTAVAFLHQTISTGEHGKLMISDNRQDRVALVVPPKRVAAPNTQALAGESRPAPAANAIGVHFVGLGRPVAGEAGVAPMSNWNNLAGFSFSESPLVDNAGASSGARLSLKDATSVWRTGHPNQLLDGYAASSQFKPMTLTLDHIPYARYTMYVYVGDADSKDTVKATVGKKTYYYTPEGTVPAGYTAITNMSSETRPQGNFIEVLGLTGASQTVTMVGTTLQYSGLCGVEIVNLGPPVRNAGAPPARTNPGVASSPRQLRGRPGLRINNPANQFAAQPERIFGGAGPEFRDTAPEKGMLIGLEVGLGKWAGVNDIVTAFRPIYVDDHGKEVLGNQHGKVNGQTIRIKAKEGYAVGAIAAKSVAALDAFSLTFMKIKDGRLDPNDKYDSEWVGGGGTLPAVTAGGDGTPAVGIAGRGDDNGCAAVGLIFAPAK